MWCTHAGKPATLFISGVPEITYGHAVWTSQTVFIKINCLTFWHPKYKSCKPGHAENDFHCHAQQERGQLQCELQDMCRETCSTSVQAVGFNRPVGGGVITITSLVLVHF